ncbi:hypothetical protein QDX92_004641 [Salmonella enterica]|nr:hypothetical protein [Salmonella enterica]EHH3361028.1 hypothetical protein [Salmonella enterica subsp. enterica serovar Sandiego]EGD1407057.1 hypothetical protein [Salmonella enterica]EJE9658128.1 hypothetical protein [Salmonella enterica]EJE9776500.1 hypothetical protein [Salmonella enterica]
MDKSKYGSVSAKWNRASVLIALVVGIFTAPQGACYLRAGITGTGISSSVSASGNGDTGDVVINIPYTSQFVSGASVYTWSDGKACDPSNIYKHQYYGSAGVLYKYITLNGVNYEVSWAPVSYAEFGNLNISGYIDFRSWDNAVSYLLCTSFDGLGVEKLIHTPALRGTVKLPGNLSPGTYVANTHYYVGAYDFTTSNYNNQTVVDGLISNSWSRLARVDVPVTITYTAKCWYSGNLDYDYNTITMDKVSGARLEKSLVINCSANTNAQIVIQPAKPPSGSYGGTETALGMGNHLDALIDFDGIKSGSSVSLQSGSNIFKVSSTLKNVNRYPVEGSYQGGGAVLINFL